jgi:hypothetical protein
MPESKPEKPVQPTTSPLGCLLRLVWLLGGNAALLLSAIWIALRSESVRLSEADAVFAVGLIASILARYLDIRYCNGTRETGEPATMADWRRYTVLLVVVGFAALGVAHGIAWYRAG